MLKVKYCTGLEKVSLKLVDVYDRLVMEKGKDMEVEEAEAILICVSANKGEASLTELAMNLSIIAVEELDITMLDILVAYNDLTKVRMEKLREMTSETRDIEALRGIHHMVKELDRFVNFVTAGVEVIGHVAEIDSMFESAMGRD